MSIKKDLIQLMKNKEKFTMKEAYEELSDYQKHSVRARIYENTGACFEKIGRGVYKVVDNPCLVIEGNGRDLSFLKDDSIDIIITDSPWDDKKSNVGGDRKFTNTYECFNYTQEDFNEKARVLKEGHFLVEMLPYENANNFKYLYDVKIMAENAGFKYFTKTSWKKGKKPFNTGRNQSNLLDIFIFSKGKARALRPDKKKIKATGEIHYMSGANAIVPTLLDYEPPSKNELIHQAEKPSDLIIKLLELFSLDGEVCLDQFAGSGSTGEACVKSNRAAILIELLNENVEKIKKRLVNVINNNLATE